MISILSKKKELLKVIEEKNDQIMILNNTIAGLRNLHIKENSEKEACKKEIDRLRKENLELLITMRDILKGDKNG